jgi:hypothetical protein
MNITRLGLALTAAVVAASTLSGCAKYTELRDAASGAAEQIASSGAAKINDATSGNLFTAEGIDHALAAISKQVGADPMQVVEVVITPTLLTAQAVDPNAPTELNAWTFTAGTVGPSRPVDYDDDTEALKQNLFAMTDVPASAIVQAIDAAVPASEIKDGKAQSVNIKRGLPFDENIRILVSVNSERSSKTVQTDATGHVTKVF